MLFFQNDDRRVTKRTKIKAALVFIKNKKESIKKCNLDVEYWWMLYGNKYGIFTIF